MHMDSAARSSVAVPDFRMTIGGRLVDGSGRFDVINPATGSSFASAPSCSREQLDVCMAAAEAGFAAWSASGWDERRAALLRMADILDESKDYLAELLTLEQGKPLAASNREIADTAGSLRAAAAIELADELVQDDERAHVVVTHKPLGVVAAITPWNYPVFLMGMKLGPALLAGNSVVVKPSPYTPLATLEACRLLAEALPAGVLNVVSGGNELGAWMTEHPSVRKISFTGSVLTGQRVATTAAADLKRYTLELGGNDAAIVLDDADPAAIGKGIFWGAFTNCGQICAGIKRLYVPEHLHDAIVADLRIRVERTRMGDGLAPGMHLGPINNLPQFERVKGLVAEAVAQGAVAFTGGTMSGNAGYFYPLTLLTQVREDMRVVTEEQFGPVLPILTYADLDEAVDRANDTRFGLSGSVWGSDVQRAAEVAARLDCGTTYVNTHLALEPHVPFGGRKWSGVGVENGPWGLREFMDLVVRYTAR